MSGAESTTEVWGGERVTRWLRQSAGLERQLRPVSQLLFAAAAIVPGERVLDVGCGTGPTTRDAAALAGAAGAVTGLDVSPEMLAAAAAVPVDAPATSAPLAWVETDVVSWTPPPAHYDLVLSRFGVMFFADPAAALGNLAAATRPGGRFTAAVWGPRGASPLFDVPYHAALDVLTARDTAFTVPDPDSGPFAWRDPDGVRALLGATGWRDVTVTPHTLALPLAGGLPPAAAAAAALDFGPSRTVTAEADETTLAAVRTAVTAALAEHVAADGTVVLDAVVQIVTARR